MVIEDPLERTIPQLSGLHLTENSESGHRWMSYWSGENVKKYQREIERRKESLTSMFYSMNLDSLWIDTGDENFIDRLLEHFIRRRRLSSSAGGSCCFVCSVAWGGEHLKVRKKVRPPPLIWRLGSARRRSVGEMF